MNKLYQIKKVPNIAHEERVFETISETEIALTDAAGLTTVLFIKQKKLIACKSYYLD